MTPVMARCPCEAHYALAECVMCTPTPPEGRNPDHTRPVQTHAPSVDDSGLTLDGPPVVVTVAIWAVGAIALVMVGAVVDLLRGDT